VKQTILWQGFIKDSTKRERGARGQAFLRLADTRIWVELHERAFRRLGGVTRVMVLDNLAEGVLAADIYDPALNPLYRDMLTHYGVVALPCRVGDRWRPCLSLSSTEIRRLRTLCWATDKDRGCVGHFRDTIHQNHPPFFPHLNSFDRPKNRPVSRILDWLSMELERHVDLNRRRPAWENGQCCVFNNMNAHGVDLGVPKMPINAFPFSAAC